MKQADLSKLIAESVAESVAAALAAQGTVSMPPTAAAPKVYSTALAVERGSFVGKAGSKRAGQTIQTLQVRFADASPFTAVSKETAFWLAVVADVDKGSQSAIRKALSGK